jgi:signal transduction histidine kinase
MWFGTSWKTLLCWRNGEFTSFTPPIDKAIDQAELVNTVVFPGNADRLWVGAVQNGVLTLNHDEFSRPFPASDIGTVARVIYRDRRDRVWLGSEFGLYCWEQEKLKRFTVADGFTARYVMSITDDAAGNLWIGTAMGELWRYRDGQFTNYRPQDTLTDAQAVAGTKAVDSRFHLNRSSIAGGERFLTLHADDDQEGVIWIGTLGGGLLRFQKDKFTRFTMQQGLPGESVSQILEDGRGQLWLGTRGGIARVSKAALTQFAGGGVKPNPFVSYGKRDGLPTVECSSHSQPACWRGRDGRLWFATVKGAVWVDPAKVPFNSVPPPVVIEEITVDGQRQAAAGSSGQEPSVRLPAHLEVSPGRHYFEFKFTALSFLSPDKVRFRWRLAGLEKDWGREKNERSASYSFLPFGNYEFQVQACNNDGVWNETGAALKLTVLPYFWQTWWFKITSVILFAGGLAGGISYFERRKREQLQHQRALEQERARIARDIHDDLGSSLTRITLLSNSARSDLDSPAQAASSLARIAVTAMDLTRAMDEIVWAVNPRHDRLDSLVNYIGKFAQDFLSAGGITFRLDVPTQLPRWSLRSQVRHNLFLAVKEALHNVLKHASATQVRVVLTVESGGFRLSIVDNGCGFVPGVPGRATNPPELPDEGNGLVNMKTRLDEIGGHCAVRSAPGDGTSVTFTVPVKNHEQRHE